MPRILIGQGILVKTDQDLMKIVEYLVEEGNMKPYATWLKEEVLDEQTEGHVYEEYLTEVVVPYIMEWLGKQNKLVKLAKLRCFMGSEIAMSDAYLVVGSFEVLDQGGLYRHNRECNETQIERINQITQSYYGGSLGDYHFEKLIVPLSY